MESAPDVLAAGQHRHGKREKEDPPDALTVNQHVRVCVERCPLTTRYVATRSGDSFGRARGLTQTLNESRVLRRDLSRVEVTRQLRRDVHPETEADHEARSQPHSSPQKERTMSGIATSQVRATTTALETTTSTRSARRRKVVLVKQLADHVQHEEWRSEEHIWVSTWT